MEKVRAALFKMLGKSKSCQDQFYTQQLCGHWPELVGQVLSRHTFPEKISRRRLLVFSDNPVWSSEMMIHKEYLLEKFNQDLGETVLKDMSFLLGKGRQVKKKAVANKKKLRELPLLSEAETQKITCACPKLQNKTLQAQALAFSIKRAREQKYLSRLERKKCPGCGVYLAEGEELCPLCRQKKIEDQRRKTAACLKEKPWLTTEEIHKMTGIEEMLIFSVKESLKAYYGEKVRRGEANEEEIRRAVFLQSGLVPEKLTPELYENIKTFLRGKKHHVHPNGK